MTALADRDALSELAHWFTYFLGWASE
jgi:hypothetical protein